jgi:general secretion pathway protein E
MPPNKETTPQELAENLGMEVLQENFAETLDASFFHKIPYAFLKQHLVYPYAESAQGIHVAICDPLLFEPLEELRFLCGKNVFPSYCSRDVILERIQQRFQAGVREGEWEAQEHETGVEESAEAYDLLDRKPGLPQSVKMLNVILTEAIEQGVSDIHFEPTEEGLVVRFRIDGVLQKRPYPAAAFQQQIISRLKVLAKMDIAEKRLPQDGRIRLKMGARPIDFRVSTVPIVSGERVVLRILDRSDVVLGLKDLGMYGEVLERFKRVIRSTEGIVLVTGPTGSGKTTTLYGAIEEISSEKVNIMTVEDPVEYHLKGISQIGVNEKIGLTFSKGLRHILRQDPDVILVGEIRDRETAEIAVQSSLTGHLVLSTLHTNDAPSAITRLVDMGIEPFLLSSSVVAILAQRLVRKLCSHCKEAYIPEEKELKLAAIKRETLVGKEIFRAKGCSECLGTGYKGRIGIFELLLITKEMQRLIATVADANALRQQAKAQGMRTLFEEGAALVLSGKTSIEELISHVQERE